LFKKPSPLTPWLFACAVIANNVAMNFQFVLDPSGNAIAVIMIMISVTGALIMDWRAFTFTMLATGVATTWTLLTYMHVGAEGWIVAAYTAMGMSALILWGRSQTAGRLAQASLLARELATTDSLTGLLNRRGIDLEEVHIHRRAIREKSTIFAMFCDIEGLKLVNDTDGHSAGDLLLVSMSDALTRAVRPDDLVARWGGDEFVIVGVGQSPDPDEFIERLHTQLAQSPLPHSWDRGVTVGIASGEVDSLPEIIEQADINMYQHRNRP
jgi:diguanylate cyclase (GGDEF)-like protein